MGRKAIIDIESYIYRASVATQSVIKQGKYYIEAYDLDKARDFLKEFMDNILNTIGADDYVVVLGGINNFRKIINPSYKANRKEVKRHPMLNIVTQEVPKMFNTVFIPYLEADDTCRIIYEENKVFNIIVSIDKDLKSFPCRIYNPLHPELGVQDISVDVANQNFYRQLIMGDATDGYNGIPKYGEAKANKEISNSIDIEGIKKLYIDNGLTEKDFINTYNMAKILSSKDYDDGIIKLYNSEFNTEKEKEV